MRHALLTLVFILLAMALKAQDDGWMVQVAVYDKQVPTNHFHDITSQLYYSKDANDFHRYFVGKFSEANAKATSTKLEGLGYNTTVMHDTEFNAQCACYKTPRPRLLTPSLRSIFFDFDRYNLRSESRRQLNLLARSLKNNPTYSARLLAHTDAKGSNDYNDKLSTNRANAARNYLIANGISSSRIKIETFGENSPIAKNELENGRDTEEGRQLNRRVELEILNEGGESMNIVEDIYVPSSLKNN